MQGVFRERSTRHRASASAGEPRVPSWSDGGAVRVSIGTSTGASAVSSSSTAAKSVRITTVPPCSVGASAREPLIRRYQAAADALRQ